MTDANPETITRLLHDWRKGSEDALSELVPLVYDELRRIAGRQMRAERDDHTLQPTALVHEAYARLLASGVEWKDRVHFFAVASTTMRRVLVDHARKRGAARRGGGWIRTDDAPDAAGDAPPLLDILALDEVLSRLETIDARKAKGVEMHYFGGMGHAEIAEALGVSEITVTRDLRFARAWLFRELNDAPGA